LPEISIDSPEIFMKGTRILHDKAFFKNS